MTEKHPVYVVHGVFLTPKGFRRSDTRGYVGAMTDEFQRQGYTESAYMDSRIYSER